MTDDRKPNKDAQQPMFYQIKIKGQLDPRWTDWFEGLLIAWDADGNTILSGPVVDQSALHGILKKIRDLGLPLLSVISLDADPASRDANFQGDPAANPFKKKPKTKTGDE